MIFVRWIFSWKLPCVPHDPAWLALAAASAAVLLLGMWMIELVIDRRNRNL
jgi:hypothetical protein